MIGTVVLRGALAGALLSTSGMLVAGSPVMPGLQGASQATAAQAAPFVGDWTLSLQGPDGPATFAVSVKSEKEKVTGEIASEKMPKQEITDVSVEEKSLILRYSFNYEGNPVPTMVALTPAEEGKMSARIDFAEGAYIMTGTAAKKDQAK